MKYLIATVLGCLVLANSGCAASQKINTSLLEQSRNKTFRIGIVKAAGISMSGLGSSALDQKNKALEKIPLAELCSILSSKYSISINSNVDTEPKVVKDAMSSSGPPPATNPGSKPGLSFGLQLQPSVDNAYYGNWTYDNASTLGIAFGNSSAITNKKEFPDVLNVTYWVEYDAFSFKTSFHYQIDVLTSEKIVIQLHGVVARISTPMKHLFADQDGIWNAYIENAAHVSDALRKDIADVKTSLRFKYVVSASSAKDAP
jgi:hypothetical protein